MKDLINRLTSRTLWVTIGTVIMLMAEEQYTEAASVAIAYILGEKTVDTLKGRSSVHIDAENIESQNVDSRDIVSGSGTIRRADEDMAIEKK